MTNLDKIATHPLQSSAWAEFRREWGNEVLETKHGILTLHKIFTLPKLSSGGLFIPNKIGMFEKGLTPTKTMLDDLKKIGKENNLIFIKLEPNAPVIDQQTNHKLTGLMVDAGAVPGRRLFTPTTFWIDLTPSEEYLMKSFHPKTRYNIRLAERNGVTVKEDDSKAAFEKYLDLTRETVTRQGFYAHTEKYHRLMWEILKKAGIAHLLTATYKGEVITTWILFTWRDFLYYPYGASTEKYKQSLAGKTGKNVMANNLMMWEAIKFGKKLGLKTFDLWGREEGKGFTKFKEGYNPKVTEFLGTWDLVINKPLYTIYRLAEKIRWPTLKLAAKFGLSKHRF
jgi:lipid II:glycine glycyltransferase (peptidoglycan interpeptide bridge formation enzyme)